MSFITQFPHWLITIDYISSFFMWMLILRFLFNIFFTYKTEIKYLKNYYNFSNKFMSFFEKITPSIIPLPLHSLYLAWLIFMFRFYLLPLSQGFDQIGYLSFPLERYIIEQIFF